MTIKIQEERSESMSELPKKTSQKSRKRKDSKILK